MSTSVLPPVADLSDLKEVMVEFPDNRLLIELCGEYDKNLAAIEQKLGVQILRRGNQLAVIGSEATGLEAAQILNHLYERLESGREVLAADGRRDRRGPRSAA